VTGAGPLLAGALIAALAAVAPAGTARPATAAVTYTCTGDAPTDESHLQPLIDAGGEIVLAGPLACAGNYTVGSNSVSIAGAGAGATLNGQGTGSILVVDDSTVALSNLTLTNGDGSGPDDPGDPPGHNGGAVSLTDSTLTVTGCRLVDNRASDQGGAIHAAESTLTVTNSLLADNISVAGGGGIDADDDVDLTIARSTVSGNSTGPHGGGVELFDGTLAITGSTINGNSVTGSTDFRSGGGIWTGLSTVTLTGTTVKGNSSTEVGGGIGFSGGPGSSMTLRSSTVVGNRARLGGGGIRNDAYYGDAPLTIDHSTIAGNTAAQGGGIDVFGLHGFTATVVVLDASDVSANRASLGGGIDAFVDPTGGAANVTVTSRIDANTADFGAGIAANGANGASTVFLRPGAALVGNAARYDGGGVFTRNGATLVVVPVVTMRLNSPDNVATG
jgi:hypothetical protein